MCEYPLWNMDKSISHTINLCSGAMQLINQSLVCYCSERNFSYASKKQFSTFLSCIYFCSSTFPHLFLYFLISLFYCHYMIIWRVVLQSRWCRIGYYHFVSKLTPISLLCETAEVLTVCLSSGDGIWLGLWPHGLMVYCRVQHLGYSPVSSTLLLLLLLRCLNWKSINFFGSTYLVIFSFVANYEEQKCL